MEQITDVYVYIRSLSSLLGGSSMLLLPAKREQDNGQSDEARTAEGHGSLSEDVPRQSWEGWPLSEHPDQRHKAHITIAATHTRHDMLRIYHGYKHERSKQTIKQNENELVFYTHFRTEPTATVMRQPSRGTAGQPRLSSLRRLRSMPEACSLVSARLKRNTKRGLRNQQATERRKQNRSNKRNIASRLHRIKKRPSGAPAQELRPKDTRTQFNRALKFATLNVRGLKAAGKRK